MRKIGESVSYAGSILEFKLLLVAISHHLNILIGTRFTVVCLWYDLHLLLLKKGMVHGLKVNIKLHSFWGKLLFLYN